MQKLTHSRAIVFFFKTEILTQHGRIYSFIFLFTKLLNDEPQTHNPKVAPQILLPQPVNGGFYNHRLFLLIFPKPLESGLNTAAITGGLQISVGDKKKSDRIPDPERIAEGCGHLLCLNNR